MFKIKDAWQIVEEVSTEGTWTDVRDGQVYPYKKFGNQIWMTVNFNYGGKQGDWVPNTTAQSAGHAWKYKNVQDYEDWNSSGIDRGAFYTLDSLRSWVVPEGWHIPTKSEWDTLVSWAMSEYGDTSKARPALMAKTTKWRSAQTLYSWDDFGLAGFNMIPGGYMSSSDSGLWGDSSLAWNTCIYRVPNSSIATEARVEKTMFNSNTSILFRNQDNWSTQAVTIRLIKDSGAYVPQPAISTITTTLDSTGSDNKLATEKATRSAITNATSSKMSNPMTTAGDIIVGGTSGAPSRLATGTQGQVLKVGASGLEWGNEATAPVQSVSDTNSVDLTLDQNGDLSADLKIDTSTPGNVQLSVSSNGLKGSFDETVKALSGDNPVVVDYNSSDEYTVSLAVSRKAGNKVEIVDDQGQDSPGIYVPTPELDGVITTAGDLIVGGASGVPEALSAGAEGKVLKIVSGVPAWGDDIGFNNPMTTAGDIIVGGASGAPSRLASGTQGQVLKVGSNGPEWGTDEGMLNPMTSANDLIIGGTSGAPDRLGAGSDRQILTVNGGTVMWENSLYALNADNSNDTYMFYTQFEDTNTRAGAGYENKLKLLGMNNASVGNILSLRAGTPVQSGMVPQNEPYWRTESDVFNAGSPMTAIGDLIIGGASGVPSVLHAGTQGKILKVGQSGLSWETDGWDDYPLTTSGDVMIGGTNGAPTRLGIGTEGQILTVGSSGTPEWQDIPQILQESYNIALSDNKYDFTNDNNIIFFSKFIANETSTKTKLGFYHVSGIQGNVMIGVYDDAGNLIGQCPKQGFSTAENERMYWMDATTPFTLEAGKEYTFAIWVGYAPGGYNVQLVTLGIDHTASFDQNIIGTSTWYTEPSLPSVLPSLQYGTKLFYVAVK